MNQFWGMIKQPEYMLEWIKKLWKDPVGSKVIAACIIFILSQIGIFLWGFFKSLNFCEAYSKLFTFLSANYTVKGWYLILVWLFLIAAIFIVIIKGLNKLKYQNSKEKAVTNVDNELPIINEIRLAPTVFFHHRFCDAFPGTENGVTWFKKRRDIHNRLQILLKSPTKFDKADGQGLTTDPVWWYRGDSALFINRFRILNKNKVLINIEEYIIEKIAAYRGKIYYRDFVYVQCLPDKPTGLYKHDPKVIESFAKEYNEYTEEFGIYKGRFITRQEYDDGSAIIKGKPVQTIGAELRSRTLTKFNFIITSKFSPYNCDDFYRYSIDYFTKLQNDEIQFEEFINWMEKFPKNHHDD